METTLREFNDLQGNDSRRRIIGQFHPEFSAYSFERKRHLPDYFRFKCLA
jgi:hypothetical protein